MSEEKKKGLTAKQYLCQLEVIDTKIQQMLEELDNLVTDSTSAGGIDYSMLSGIQWRTSKRYIIGC